MIKISTRLGAAGLLFAASATPALAETLPVRGIYPAGNDAAASLNTIAIETFGGVDGQAIAIAIGDQLRGVHVNGEPYFTIVPSSANADADAVLQGTAMAEASRRDSYPREREICVERDEDRECIREEKEEIPCWERVVHLDPRIRLVAANGNMLDAFDNRVEKAVRYCRGDNPPSTETMVGELVDGIAADVRYSFAPVERLEDIRVMERRRGLEGDDRDAFRNAVRLTDSDPDGACAGFRALEAANPGHVSVLFNIGLCHESWDELDVAQDYYRRALETEPGADYPSAGFDRIEQRYRADMQLANHYGH